MLFIQYHITLVISFNMQVRHFQIKFVVQMETKSDEHENKNRYDIVYTGGGKHSP